MIQPLFFCIRHGECASNDLNVYRGKSNRPDAQLSPEGRDGVCESAIFLKHCGYEFPLIICDDLDRTKETAQITASILGVKEIELVPSMTLDVGDYTGKSKKDFPIDEFIKDKNKRIPGGETINEASARFAKIAADVLDLVEEIKKPVLIVAHGSFISFLHNHMTPNPGQSVGYEGLVHPSGVLVFTADGIIPLIKKRHPVRNPYKDGTRVAGFVTEEENVPPRECWNCRYFNRDVQTDLGGCKNLLVRIDPELESRRQSDGTVAVGDRDCCDLFQNKIAT